jgi:hypothetical protein
MDSIAKARNHYETLGLATDASSDEIARAYARGIGLFGSRTLTDVAEASIAFETLRDPDRRRAYDSSIGLGRPVQPRILSTGGRAQYIGPAPACLADGVLHATAVPHAARPQAPTEPRTASFIAASLRRPAEPATAELAVESPAPDVRPAPQAEPPAAGIPTAKGRPPLTIREAAELRLADADEEPVQWSRTLFAAGGLIAGVVVIGALAGLEAGRSAEPQAAEAAVTAALPAPKPAAASVVQEAPPPAPRLVAQQPARHTARAPLAVARAERPSAPNARARLERFAEAIQSNITPVEAGATQPAVVESAPPETTAAALPLPDSVVARTIERIGYSCGKVASTSAIEGSSGAYTVTCTSGQSYRAAPVRGRYHFRRISGR